MNIFGIEFETWNTIVLTFNWLAFLILFLGVLGISYLLKRGISYTNKRSINIDEVNLGIGNSSVKLSYSRKDQEIAYKLWVELSTRKIGISFEQENDIIKEVYDSWYRFFEITRELLKEMPINKVSDSSELIKLTENVLNIGLRPHLTKWQAKYRKWYEEELKSNTKETPQEIQKRYPEYEALVEDLVETNKKMIEYKLLMEKIAFNQV